MTEVIHDTLIEKLLAMAMAKHGVDITLCGSAKNWNECVRVYDNQISLYYNDAQFDSTHIVSCNIADVN